jgi:branched-chain amino acid transport system permease protein
MMTIPKGLFIGSIILPAFLPVFFSPYVLTLLFTIFINISLTAGINLLWGFSGYMNLGYMVYFGLGAYGTAILTLAGWSFPVGLLVCLPLFSFLAGLIALLLFRLQGIYFSVVSLGVLILLEESAGKLIFLSGGPEGLSLPLGNYTLESYWLSLGLALLSLALTKWIDRQRLGYGLRMIQEDEQMAQAIGVPVLFTKITAYVLGAFIASLAGAIYVRQSGYIGPASAFGLAVAMPPVIMALIGGGRRWWGPLLGAIILTGLQEALWTGFNRWVLSGYGIILILAGFFHGQGEKLLHRSFKEKSPLRSFFKT